MNIVETPWEKRNLGVNGVEYYFDESDSCEGVADVIANDKEHDYQVAYVPVGKMEIAWNLEGLGFSFAETRFRLTANLRDLHLPEKIKVLLDDVSYHRATEEDLKLIYNAMEAGVFDTDKVALDSHFSPQAAGHRYALWTQDEINANRVIPYIVTNKDEKIGFMILKLADENVADSFLGALFDKDKFGGFGYFVVYFLMEEAKKMGRKRIVTGVSSNNPDSLRIHFSLGYNMKMMQYVYIKHVSSC